MALNDFWMLTLFQRWGSGGEQMLNNFFFTSVDPTANATACVEAFTEPDSLLEAINNTQMPYVENERVRCINLGSLTDFYEANIPDGGLLAPGDVLPIFNAISYSLKLNTRALRPGGKRFSGVSEAAGSNGIVTDTSLIANINALEIALAGTISNGTITFTPVVVKRVRLEPDVDHLIVRYRLPETDEELVYGTVTGVLASMRISHQVSRGNGR